MTVAEFIVFLRQRLADPVRTVASDQHWTDAEFLQYVNEICYEFARRTEYFIDSTTAAICRVAVTATDPWVDISDRIIRILRAKLELGQRPLRVMDSRQMDESGGDWDPNVGNPRILMLGEETGRARFDRVPQVSDTLHLRVVKLPAALTTVDDTIAVPEQYVMQLIPGARSMAYAKQDADTFDANKSLALHDEFQGNLTAIKRELKKLRRRTSTVRYSSP